MKSINTDTIQVIDPPSMIWLRVRDAFMQLLEDNPKLHDIPLIIDSLQRYGLQELPKFDGRLNNGKGGIKAGNGRIEALYKMEQQNMPAPRGIGIEKDSGAWVMPVVVGVDAASESAARAYVIDSNNIGLQDLDAAQMYDAESYARFLQGLAQELPESVSEKDALALMQALIATETKDAAIQADNLAELRERWPVKAGQVWKLRSRMEGQEHLLVCGDCKDPAVLALFPDIQSIVSDPPYGMDYQRQTHLPQKGMQLEQRRAVKSIHDDDKHFDPAHLFQLCTGDIFLWGADWYYDMLPPQGSFIVWDKRASEAADAIPGSPFELCWSRRKMMRKIIRFAWGGWINKEAGENRRWHATQKPVAVMAEIIKLAKAETVFDPYVGSGSTIIAAENLGRQCQAIDIDADNVAICLQRYADAFDIKGELL